MKGTSLISATLLLVCLLLCSCNRQKGWHALTSEAFTTPNAVYYWRTTVDITSKELAFLKTHDIQRIYCRLFDVVMLDGKPMPNATLDIKSMPRDIEIVPVVFITEDCMHEEKMLEGIDSMLVKRICDIVRRFELNDVRELQIDCDYTLKSRECFYRFLAGVRKHAAREGMKVSATIRLHQLSMEVPPADYGVLMLYNTGSADRYLQQMAIDSTKAHNPILDMRDVAPYLRHLADYPLPLAAAYPVFEWQRNVHGATIRHSSPFAEIMKVKRAVESLRDDVRQHIITYHLSEENIQRYEENQFKAVYSHDAGYAPVEQ